MKNFNKNIIVFILVSILVLSGLFSQGITEGIKNAFVQFKTGKDVYGVAHSFSLAADAMVKAVSNGISYHDEAMDLNSLFNRYTGRAIVEKDDGTVIRAKNGYLGNPRGKVSDKKLNHYADNVAEFMKTANSKGADFLYVMAPSKGYSLEYPSNGRDFTKTNCDRFSEMLKEKGVPLLNLIEQAEKEDISDEEMFFATDHHWRPEKGLWASEKVSSCLEDLYGFQYDKSVLQKDNYTVTTYKDWFLGSQGKKVGRYFSPHGPDDINLIVPKFETSLAEYQPAKNLWREGTFKDLLYMENLNTKDHYNLNPYATYSGGDFREQIIANRMIPEGKTAIIIRDSYGCAFTPFFSLVLGNTHVVDIRDGAYVGEKLYLPDYIDKIKPDYVIVFYTGLSDGEALYAFK